MKEKTHKNSLQLLSNLDSLIAIACMTILIIITFAGVVFRYIVHKPFSWLEEIQTMCLVWVVFMTGGVAFRIGAHIAVEILVDMFPKNIRRIVEWIVRIVVIAILIFLMVQCFEYVMLFVKNKRLSPVLRIPYWIIYGITPIACIDMLASYIWYEITGLLGLRAIEEEGTE